MQPPFLDDLLEQARPHLAALEGKTLRDADALTPPQKAALRSLWNLFRHLPTKGQAGAVGITKAIMLLTRGRFGPALDSQVRRRLGVRRPLTSADEWLALLDNMAADVHRFEARHGIRLDDLIGKRWRPIAVGRVYDMVAGPRKRHAVRG